MSAASTSASLSFHGAFLALLLLLSTSPVTITKTTPLVPLFVPRDLLKPPPTWQPISGGGGGNNMPLPALQGMLPPAAVKVFVPPQQTRPDHTPLLEVPPTMDLPPDVPNIKASHWGDPLAEQTSGVLSDGAGKGGGIGEGEQGLVGNKRGRNYGPGDDGGRGFPGVRTIGKGVSAPRLIYQIEPEYSEDARRAKYQGVVRLNIVVDEHGMVRHVEVTAPVGLGLDEKAVDAVRKWRFQPGLQNGKAVPVWASVEVGFRLL